MRIMFMLNRWPNLHDSYDVVVGTSSGLVNSRQAWSVKHVARPSIASCQLRALRSGFVQAERDSGTLRVFGLGVCTSIACCLPLR